AQYDLTDRVAFDHHHVGTALQLPQRAVSRDQTRRHALFKPAPGHLRHTQQFNAIAHIGGPADIVDADALNPLDLDCVKTWAGAKGNGGKDRKLVAGVDPTHVKRRVGL